MSVYGQTVGRFGEKLAQQYLRKRGYTIVAINFKNSYYEIDIIAKKKRKYIFIEVKTVATSRFGDPEDNFTRKKINSFKQGIMNYVKNNKINLNFVRADLIAININKINKMAKIRHYKNII